MGFYEQKTSIATSDEPEDFDCLFNLIIYKAILLLI